MADQAILPGIEIRPATWPAAIAEYLVERSTAGCARSSLVSFRCDLQILAKMFPDRDPVTLDIKEARWAVDQAGKNPFTAARRHGTWRTFYRWLRDRGWIEESPFRFSFELTPREHNSIHILTPSQIETLLSAEDPAAAFVVRLLWETGMKSNEALNLQGGDLNFAESMIYIRGRIERSVPVSEALAEDYQAYLEAENLKVGVNDKVFPFTRRWMEKQLHKVAQSTGIAFTAQTLRWNCAIVDLSRGLSEDRLRIKLGYSELSWHMHARPILRPWLPHSAEESSRQ